MEKITAEEQFLRTQIEEAHNRGDKGVILELWPKLEKAHGSPLSHFLPHETSVQKVLTPNYIWKPEGLRKD